MLVKHTNLWQCRPIVWGSSFFLFSCCPSEQPQHLGKALHGSRHILQLLGTILHSDWNHWHKLEEESGKLWKVMVAHLYRANRVGALYRWAVDFLLQAAKPNYCLCALYFLTLHVVLVLKVSASFSFHSPAPRSLSLSLPPSPPPPQGRRKAFCIGTAKSGRGVRGSSPGKFLKVKVA